MSDELATAELPDDSAPKALLGDTSQLIILGGMTIGLLFLWDLLLWFEHGGIFSIVSAVRAARAQVPSVEIDSGGLRLPISAVLCVAILALCRWCRTDVTKRGSQFLVMVGIIGGGYLLAGLYEERIVTALMTAHGYSRCEARDREVGRGKGRVWFDDYVLTGSDCPRR